MSLDEPKTLFGRLRRDIVVSDVRVERDGRLLMRWKCSCRINGVVAFGWGLSASAAIRDALNYRVADVVLKDFKSRPYKFGGAS